MSTLWTSEAARAATGGRDQGPDWQAKGVSIDTRTLQPRDLFVALQDARDGHDFVAQALEKGAAAALVSRRPAGVPDDAPLLIVEDVLKGLEDLARAARARTRAKVIGITGSAGKTSTKDMARQVLSHQGKTHAAEASYNNHWGVPLTLARMPADTEFALIEIGMNHPGEIAPLARLARLNLAMITTVAPAHLEAFENVEAIAVEKASIFQGLEPDGIAIFNADVDTAPILNAAAKEYAARRIGFGEHGDAALCALKVTLTDSNSIVEGRGPTGPFLFKVGAPGRHFAMNALAVYGAAQLIGADPDIVACDLGQWTAPAGRGQREMIVLDALEGQSFELIDDAFNANPASVVAAFDVLAAINPKQNKGRIATGRRIAVLGDMLELGADELELHRALADHPSITSIKRVDCVGPRMKALYEALPVEKRGRWTDTAEKLAAEVHLLIDAGDVVLVKGSKGSRISLVVDALRKLHQAGNEGTE